MGNYSLSYDKQTTMQLYKQLYSTALYSVMMIKSCQRVNILAFIIFIIFFNMSGDSFFVNPGGGLGARNSDESGWKNSPGLPG